GSVGSSGFVVGFSGFVGVSGVVGSVGFDGVDGAAGCPGADGIAGVPVFAFVCTCTVTTTLTDFFPEVPLITAVPGLLQVTTPFLFTVAIASFPLVHLIGSAPFLGLMTFADTLIVSPTFAV